MGKYNVEMEYCVLINIFRKTNLTQTFVRQLIVLVEQYLLLVVGKVAGIFTLEICHLVVNGTSILPTDFVAGDIIAEGVDVLKSTEGGFIR